MIHTLFIRNRSKHCCSHSRVSRIEVGTWINYYNRARKIFKLNRDDPSIDLLNLHDMNRGEELDNRMWLTVMHAILHPVF